MKAIKSYFGGLENSVKSIRMVLMIWTLYLTVALLLAIPFYGLLARSAGNSLLPNGLMKGFDATIIRELLANGGRVLGFYTAAWLPWIIGFFLVQVFVTGGIYTRVASPRGRFSLASFMAGGRKYYWRFFKLSIYQLIIHLLIGLVLYLPYLLVTAAHPGMTDKQVMDPLIVLVTLHLAILVFLFMVSDLAKSILFEQDTKKVLKSLWRAVKLAFRRFLPVYGLGWLLLLAPALAIGLYILLRSNTEMDSVGLVLIFLLVQQVFICLRVLFRVWRLGAVYGLYLMYRK